MSRLGVIAVAVAVLGAGEANAQASGPWAAIGAGQRGTDFDVEGVLKGSLLPSVIGQTSSSDLAFYRSKSDRTSFADLSGGYDLAVGGGFFAGIDGSLSNGGASVSLGVLSDSLRNTYLPVTECAPPGVPVPCVTFPAVLHTAQETQTLTLDLKEDFGGSLGLRAGYQWGPARLWLGMGVAGRGVDLAYDLPPLQRTLTSARGGSTVSTALPAESRHEKDTLQGGVVSAGLEYDTGLAKIVLTYARTDYNAVEFFDTTRVSGLQVGATSEAGVIAVKLTF